MKESLPETTRVLSTHDYFDQELQHTPNAVPLEDNDNDLEIYHRLWDTTPDEEGRDQDSTNPPSLNRSESQDRVDLMQSLEIRQIRITNLAKKRDRLFNLLMNRF